MANGNIKGDAISITEKPDSLRRKIEQMRRFSVGNVRQTKDITDAYTLIEGDAGGLLLFTSATDENITVPATLPEGWWCACVQLGAGKAMFVAASGATVNSLASAAATAGQYGNALIEVVSNGDGASASAVVTPEADAASIESAIADLEALRLTRGTEQATTSGTAFDFTGIPADVNRITVQFDGVSLSGADDLLVQIGDAGGIEITGYDSSSMLFTTASNTGATSTSGFIVRVANAGRIFSGHMVLTRRDAGNVWISSHVGKRGSGDIEAMHGGGTKTLSGALTQLRLTRSGTDTFDAGSINILYE